MAATPNATGSAPIVSPPIAVASSGMTDSAASATSTMPSGRHAVCLVSRNHELVAPDFSVKSPRFTAWARTWSRSAANGAGRSGRSAGRGGVAGIGGRRYARRTSPIAFAADVLDRPAPHLHRAPAGRDVRRPPRRRPARRAARLRRLLPQRPLPGDGRRARGRRAARARPTRGRRSPAWPATRRRSASARSSRRRRSGCPARWRSPSPASTRCPAAASSSASAPGGTSASTRPTRIPFPPLGERFDRLEEQLAVITGLWSTPVGERVRPTTARTTRSRDSPALPKPVQAGGVPIIVGGGGPKRTPALAARFAAEYNTPFVLARAVRRAARPRRRGVRGDRPRPGVDHATPRPPSSCLGADEAEYARRAAAIGREPDELRRNGVAGTPDEVRGDARSGGPTPAPSGCTCRSSTSPTSTTSTPSPRSSPGLSARSPSSASVGSRTSDLLGERRDVGAVGGEDMADRRGRVRRRYAWHVTSWRCHSSARGVAVEPHRVVEAGDEAVLAALDRGSRRGCARTTASVAGRRTGRRASSGAGGRRRPSVSVHAHPRHHPPGADPAACRRRDPPARSAGRSRVDHDDSSRSSGAGTSGMSRAARWPMSRPAGTTPRG